MAATQIRGSTQIMDGTIPVTKLASGFQIATANLVDGANFYKKDGSVVPTADLPLGGFKITNLADAVSATDAVNLRVVQGLVNGIAIRRARLLYPSQTALTGLTATGGVTPSAGDEVLLTGQTTQSQNGLWWTAAGAWVRPSDWAAASSQKPTLVLVTEGTTYADTKWTCVTDGAIVVDTTATSWVQDSTGATYTGGTGILLTGSVFSAKLGQGLEDDGSGNTRVKLNGASLTRDANGLKLTSSGTTSQVLLTDGSFVPTWTSLSGDVTINATGVVAVAASVYKAANFVTGETPSGTINGSNVTFTLANTPTTASVELFVNGQLQDPLTGNDYTISGATITMLYALVSGDKIRANYRK